MSSTVTITCFSCKKTTSFSERVGFRGECEHCHADARVCKNCKFYDPKAYNECREPSAEVVQVKDRSNRCDFFQANGDLVKNGSPSDPKADLLKAAEALFKKN
jgi:hypothetical protein